MREIVVATGERMSACLFGQVDPAQGRELGRILGPADWASPEAIALVKAALAQN